MELSGNEQQRNANVNSFLKNPLKMHWLTAVAGMLLAVAPMSALAQLVPATATSAAKNGLTCAGVRFGSDVNCTSNSFLDGFKAYLPDNAPKVCFPGEQITVTVRAPIASTANSRYDGVLWVGEQNNDPESTDPIKTCSVAVSPTSSVLPNPSGGMGGFAQLDGDTCGDFRQGPTEQWDVTNVKITCTTATDASGNMLVPVMASYSNNANTIDCGANPEAQSDLGPSNKAMCGSGTMSVVGLAPSAKLTITKKTNPAGATDTFTFNGTTDNPNSNGGISPATFTLSDGQSQLINVPLASAGGNTVTLTETLLPTWDPTASIVCTVPGGGAATFITVDNANRKLTAHFDAANLEASCEITNKIKPPVITVSKVLTTESGTKAGIAEADETLTYTLTATNAAGSGPASNYSFYEVVPANTTLQSITGTGVSFTGCAALTAGTQQCTITIAGPTAGAASATATVVVKVDATIPADVTAINNLVTDDTSLPPGTCTPTTTSSHCVSTPVDPAKIDVTKILFSESGTQAGIAEPNETLTYRLTATNSGSASAANFKFYDVLPANTTFVSVLGGTTDCVAADAGAKLCTITVAGPVVGSGGTATVDFAVKVVAQLPTTATTINNLVTNDTTATPPLTPCPTASTHCVITPLSAPVITTKKILSLESGTQTGIAEPNETLTYTITATNSGGAAASNVQFYDVLPANTTFASITGASTDCVAGDAGAKLCKITVAGPIQGSGGTADVTFAVKVVAQIPSGITDIHNLVTDNALTMPPTTPCTPASDHCVITPLSAPVIATTKVLTTESGTQAGFAEPNETLTYTITATNSGGASASNVEFYDVLPANTTFVSISGATTDCVANDAGAKLCKITVAGPIQGSGGTADVTFAVKVVAQIPSGITDIHNLVTSNALTTPPTTPCPTANAQCVITPIAAPVITTKKVLTTDIGGTQPGIAEPNETLTYTITATNSGGASASNVEFYDVLPANTTFVSISGATSDCVVGDAGAKLCKITVAGPILGSGGTADVTFAVKVVAQIPDGVTDIHNLVTDNALTTPPTTPCPTASDHCVITPMSAPVITTKKVLTTETGTQAGIAEPNETLTYTITATNSGGAAASNVQFYDVLPANTTYVSIAGATTDCVAGDAGAKLCKITVAGPILGSGGTAEVAFAVKVVAQIPSGITDIHNLVTDNALTMPPTTPCTPASDHCVITPIAAPVIATTKVLTTESGTQTGVAEPNETLTYTITATNSGGGSASNVEFYDVLPANTTFVSISGATTDCVANDAGAKLCKITVAGPIQGSGGTADVMFAVKVVAQIPSGITNIHNLVTNDATTPPPTTPCPTANAQCVITPLAAPIMTVKKAITSESGSVANIAEPGELIGYSITVTNSGGASLSNHTFYDVLPANTKFVSISANATVSGCAAGDAGPKNCLITVPEAILGSGDTNDAPIVLTVQVSDPIPANVSKISNLVTDTNTPPGDCVPTDTNHCVEIPVAGPEVTVKKSTPVETGATADGFAQPGETLTYTVTVSNAAGKASAIDHQFHEVIPANTKLVSITGTNIAVSPNCVANTAGPADCVITLHDPIAGGASQTLQVAVMVNDPIPAGVSKISNLVTDNINPPGDCVPSDTNHCVETPVQAPLVTVKKAAPVETGKTADGIAQPGETLTYAVTISNAAGKASKINHQFHEVIPANTTLVSITGTNITVSSNCVAGTVGSADCLITLNDSLAGGASQVLQVAVMVNDPIPAGVKKISNLVTDDETPPGDCVPSDTNHCVEIPVGDPVVTVKKATPVETGKTADGIAQPGETLTYAVTVSNAAGKASAVNHQFHEVIPANTTLVSITGTNITVSPNCVAGTIGSADCLITLQDPIAGGASQVLQVAVMVNDPIPAGVTKISNLVTDDATPPGDCVPSDTNHCVETPVGQPQVTVKKATPVETGKTADGIAQPGELLTYAVTISNATGVASAINHQFHEIIPANTTLQSITGTNISFANCTVGTSGTQDCVITLHDSIAGGASQVLQVAVLVNDPIPAGVTKISNLVTDNINPPGDCVPTDTNHCVETPVAGPEVTVKKSIPVETGGTADGFAQPGETLTYTVTASNAVGKASVIGHQFHEVLPANTTLVSITGTNITVSPNCVAGTAGPADCVITLNDEIAGGASQSLQVAVKVNDPIPAGVTKISNLVTDNINPPGDCVPSDTNHCVETPVQAPLVTVKKDKPVETGKTADGLAQPGETLTYAVTVSNAAGKASAINHKFHEVIPANTTLVSITGTNITVSPNCVAGTVGSADCLITLQDPIAGGASQVLQVAVMVNDPIPAGVTKISNLVTDDVTPPGDCVPSDTNHCVETPVGQPKVTVKKDKPVETGKTADGIAQPGETLTYAVTISNATGVASAVNHQFHEVVPANTTLVSITGTNISFANCTVGTSGTQDCLITLHDSIAGGASQVIQVAVMVNDPIPAGVTKISNLVTDDANPPGDCVPSDTNHCVETPVGQPQVTVKKDKPVETGATADGIAQPGETLTYAVTISNATGVASAVNHQFHEVIPANTTLLSITGRNIAFENCTVGTSGTQDCIITLRDSIAGGASQVIQVAVKVNDPIPAGVTKISNLVTDNINPPGDCVPSDTNHCVETPVGAPVVTVKKDKPVETGKTADGIAQPGELLTYTVTVSNAAGTASAINHQFHEVIPANTTLQSITGTNISFENCTVGTSGTQDCLITLKDPIAGGAQQTLQVAVMVNDPIPAGVTKISNLVTDTSAPPGDCVPSDTNHCVETPVGQPNVTVKKDKPVETGATADGFAQPGETLTYTVTISNATGVASAVNHQFHEVIPANTTLQSITGTNIAFENCTVGTSGTQDCLITLKDSIAGGASQQLTVAVKVNDPIPAGVTKISNLVTDTSAPPGDCVPSDTNHCVETPVQSPEVTVVKAKPVETGATADGFAQPGETLTYTITASNAAGKASAINHTFHEVVPANTTLLSITGTNISFANCTVGTSGKQDCLITLKDPIAGGASQQVTVAVKVNDPIPAGVTKISNLVTNDATPPGDCVPTDTNHCVETPVQPALITTSKKLTAESGSKPGIVEAGETLTYTITVKNSGGASASNVQFYDVLPMHTTFVSVDDKVTTDCKAGDAPPKKCVITVVSPIAGNGGTMSFLFTVKAASPIPAGVATINNVVTDTLETPPVVCDENSTSDHCVVTPVEQPRMSIAKTLQSGGPEATPNGILVYALTISNSSGTSALIPVGAIMESVPAQTTAQDSDDFTCAVNAVAGTKCGNKAIVTVPGYGSTTLLFRVKVVAQPTPGTKTISNVVVPPEAMTCDAKELCTEVTPLKQNPPVAVDDFKRADNVGQTVTLSASANDYDPDGDLDVSTINILLDGAPSGGGNTPQPTGFAYGKAKGRDTDNDGDMDELTVTDEGQWNISNNGDATFVPLASFTGDPTPIPYNIKDKSGLTSNTALITIVYPKAAAQLFVQKRGSTNIAEVGDIVTYTVTVKNTGQVAATPAVMVDRLPAGFLLVDNVTVVQGAKMVSIAGAPGPVINVTLDTLAPGATAMVIYRVRVGVGASEGDGINRVHFECPKSTVPGVCSNESEWKVRIEGGVFTNDGCVVGQVFVDCNWNSVKDKGELGIPGVRLYMEDGTYFITDVDGKYSYCGLRPTTHGIKADSKSLPAKSRLITSSNRNTGDAESIFVDLKNGEMQRADFIEGSCTPEIIEQVENRINGSGPNIQEAKRAPVKFQNKPAN